MSRNMMSTATRRAAIAAAVATALAVSACGGGGGSGNTVNEKPGVALFTNAGSAVTVKDGSTAEFSIGGGAEKFVSYSASSSDTKVATVVVDGSKLKITGLTAGEATVTVTDSAGANIKIAVKVPANELGKLAVSAPSTVTLVAGMSSQYRVSGGTGPYSVAVSNPNVIAATTANGVISLTAANPGSATIVVFDASGASSKFEVTVPGAGQAVALYTTAPESLRMSSKISGEYIVNGGTGPYAVTTTDAEVVTGSISGNKLVIVSGKTGRGLLNIRDAAGTLEVVTVTVAGEVAVPLYSTAPSNVTLAAGSSPTYQIEGGVPPYIASTSNADIAQASIVSGNQLQIKGISAGVADIVVFDSTGVSFKVGSTVGGGTGNVPLYSTSPEAITLALGAAPSYKIAGGAAPYTVSTSNPNVAQATVVDGNQLLIKGLTPGVAEIVVFDRSGASFKVAATVGGGNGTVPLYSTSPEAITVGIGAEPTYKIAGGAAPYTVTSSNVAVATVSQTATTFSIKGVAAGQAGVSIRDANGSSVNILVEVR